MTTTRTEPVPIPTRGDDVRPFAGTTPEGTTVRPRDFYMRRNLALAFTHGPSCAACRDLLRDLARQHDAARAEVGEIVAVVPATREAAGRLRDDLDLIYPVVADEDLAIHRGYGLVTPQGAARAALIVADRYGTIFETSVADDAHRMMAADQVPGWLEFIACQCS